ncbi:MAG TPA: peptidyl-prolyl cis-trans isomerase, partial [Burkholderiaceae bacterium]|nr:peptidyl-prolyl cis-trans isomerase [Burkholderiaceae bacterium]
LEQERTVRLASFKPASYVDQIKPSPEALKAYYEANKSSFETPERADIEYVVLDLEAVMRDVKLDPEEVKRYYEQNTAKFRTEEQRRARHILIAVGADASEAQRKAARDKAEDLRNQLLKNPASFEQLARKFSDDPGSKDRGGDLDFFGRDAMAKPFEEAVFALKEGEISQVVQTEFGFHVIQLTGLRPAQVKPFEQARAEIETDLRRQLAMRRFGESAEIFTNTVYEQTDSLKPVAEKLGLEVRTVKGFTRESAGSSNPLLSNPKFVDAVFSNDATRNKRNTAAVEVAANTLVAAHVTSHQPRALQPFESVEAEVRAAVQREQARELAQKTGEEKLTALKAGKGEVSFGEPTKVTRRNPNGLSPDALRAVMRVDAAKLPAFVGVDLGQAGYAIYRVDSVAQPNASDANQRRALSQQLVRTLGEAEANAHLEAVRSRAKVEILRPVAPTKNVSEQAS